MFNFEALTAIRHKNHIRQEDLAKSLGIMPSYLSMLERGQREPSMKLIYKLVKVTHVPLGTWLSDSSVVENAIDNAAKLRREHSEHQQAMEQIWELKCAINHLRAENSLRKRFEDIVLDIKLSKSEKMKKRKELAVTAMAEGELSFNKIAEILRMGHPELRGLLDRNPRPYKCSFLNSEIMASSPGEAGLCLHCSECAQFELGKCLGHGDENPKNIVEMLERLKFNGIYTTAAQVDFLAKHCELMLSEEEIRNIRYKARKGHPIPDEVFHMDIKRARQ